MTPRHYRIIAVGKIRKQWIQKGIDEYLKRLPGLSINEIRDSNPEKESKEVVKILKKSEGLIALSEEGESLKSIDFARRLQKLGSNKIAFLIGGAEGITNELKNSSILKLSLSPMTLPHEIARLILLEQIYRASTILQGGPYHR